ncbi:MULTISPECIES: DUF2161 family putative PD-(D/E)XK-type phosphodiesterase [unclassified Rhizobium]|uniref:DUF2161 domain-containing phosphodiesterase n=1 Tax=Rhizobium TaxID=379 RepID=UPI00084C0174|nr:MULTISPECIES: DUF2161 family putative PD-(D/E)XK-type phosphodiesterase [unclassified Rhizobium]OED01679.1 hypothetical protein A9Z06_05490 [Rhizobium sp. YK2]QYA15319.1 hypothetical protein J5284_20120 [Rhizobium sp. AB2/73]UEQ83813.1 hypothetical protein I8E17_20890 [Rhizobium sp. AB2/73]
METALYLPIKSFLEAAGYAVKGEIGGCDLVGLTDDEPPVVVICELKMTFNLELILQAVDRAAASDEVWIAARVSKKGKGREGDRRFRDLCRRLGFGMLAVSDSDVVDIVISPIAPMPRKNARRRSRLVDEHRRRKGDPALGGSTRKPIMTAYRQQALACAAAIENGVQRPKDMREAAPKAPQILRDNVYGWFERIDRGIYALTELGTEALKRWPAAQL